MRKLVSLLPLAALAACTVGPDYKGPQAAGAVPPPARFVRADAGENAARPVLAHWWTSMGDPLLDRIEEKALAGNADLAASVARVKQARASLGMERANRLPNGSAMVNYIHAELPGVNLTGSNNGSGGTSSLDFFNAAFDANWELDLFGGKRRGVEAARASAGAAEANLADAQVSLTAEVAQSYINLRDRQQRLALAERLAAHQREIYELTAQRVAQGTASGIDLENQHGLVDQVEGAIAPLKAERDAYLNALAALMGEAPGALDAMLEQAGAVPLPPAEVAVGDPAALLQRRPDVRAAERRMAAASARIGVAEAARFPTVKMTGLVGLGGTNPGDMFDLGKFSAIAAPQVTWNFLDFGRNAARIRQAKGAYEEAQAQYRGAVLTALRDAEDALARYGAARAQVASAARASQSAERGATLTQQRFAAGTTSRIDLLQAQRQSLSARQVLSQAVAAMSADYVALQKAFGLGWQ